MFTLHLNHRLIRRTGFVVLVVLSLLIALLPSVALAAPVAAPMIGVHDGGPGDMGGGNGAHYYMVRRGETLSGIAARLGVSVWALCNANGIGDPNHIYAGQWLYIPSGGQPGYPGGPGYHGNVYTVRHGDTLSALALRFSTSVWWLMQVNHISNPNHIYAGQGLRVR